MTPSEVSKMLWNACQQAGVDPEVIFAHYDAADIEAYRDALADGSVRHEDLPRWMESTAATIRERRCLCRACKGVKA